MTFEDYQRLSRQTAIYPDLGRNFVYPTLGLTGEAGEVSEKIKKVLRDRKGDLDDETRRAVSNELGDVLWYVAQLASELELSLDDIATENIEKLASRRKRGRLSGEGDNR